ncbi:MAG: DUF6325 family protein [Actinomycetota bacterium]
MELGPVDVVLVAFGEPRFDGSVLAELEMRAGQGAIRVLDAMVIVKGEDGLALTLDLEDLDPEDKAALGFIETGTRGLFDSDDADTLIEGMVPGSAVMALAIENTWAVGLRNAILGVGGEVAMTFRIPGPIMEEALVAIGVE